MADGLQSVWFEQEGAEQGLFGVVHGLWRWQFVQVVALVRVGGVGH
ncbi:hypothetical protein [Streptomyces sioyaensis]